MRATRLVHDRENVHRVGAQNPGPQQATIGPISIKPMQYNALGQLAQRLLNLN